MDCRLIRTRFADYVDAALSAPLQAQVEEHISDCADCASELEALRAFLATLDEFIVCPGPGYAFHELHARLALAPTVKEIIELLPKLRLNQSFPRFAISACLLIGLALSGCASRNARRVYEHQRSVILGHRDKLAEVYDDYLQDDSLAKQLAEGTESSVAEEAKDTSRSA